MNEPVEPYILSKNFYIPGYKEPFQWIIDNNKKCWIKDVEFNSYEEFSRDDLT